MKNGANRSTAARPSTAIRANDLPILDPGLRAEIDAEASPPLPGKSRPRHEMTFVVPTADDEHRRHPHHPNEGEATELHVDPDVADAAADLAGDLGGQFLSSAISGEDISEHAMRAMERADGELPLVVEAADAGFDVDDALLDEVEIDWRASQRRRSA